MKEYFKVLVIFVYLFPLYVTASEKDENPFVKCVDNQKVKDLDACLERVGRIEWYPYKSPDMCALTRDILSRADNSGFKLSWKLLFMNERCKRLGEPYYER
jgi:hypothetical protein